MANISNIHAREILDSRGDPTVEVEIELDSGIRAIASVPSGASVGSFEVVELRDGDESRYGGKGVLKAIESVTKTIAPALIGQDAGKQAEIDGTLNDLDGSEHKTKLGANAILAVSLALCKAAAAERKLQIYEYISELSGFKATFMPRPMFNFIEGAKHADNNLEIQEFMVIPMKNTFKENYRVASEQFHKLQGMLKDRKLGAAVGHEGGFAPNLESDEQALQFLSELKDVKIGLDMAGVIPKGMAIDDILVKYPIVTLEDPYGEDDWNSWTELMKKYSKNILVIGDDLLATNKKRLEEGIAKASINAVIVKPNQIGTVTEAIEFCKLAKSNNLRLVVSHRSGETEDSFISDFAVGVAAEYAKLGAPSRGERVSKYNRLLRIEGGLFADEKNGANNS